jgi:hypothetical protein
MEGARLACALWGPLPEFINRIRARVKVWRQQSWPGTTNTTAALLRH